LPVKTCKWCVAGADAAIVLRSGFRPNMFLSVCSYQISAILLRYFILIWP
jgi:hypothetical protein